MDKECELGSDFDYKKALRGFDLKVRMKISNEVERRVAAALKAEADIVEARRERLKELLKKDDNLNNTSYNQIQSGETVYESMQRKILEIELRRERERKEFVEEKRQQQKFLNCEPIRTVLSKQQEETIKKDQWWQIQAKIAASSEKAKDDAFYHEMIFQNVREAIKLDQENAMKKWEAQVEVKNGYQKQIEEKNRSKEEETLKKNEEKLLVHQQAVKAKEEEDSEKLERLRKMAKLDAEMKEMMKKEKEARARRLQEEKSMADEIDFIASTGKTIDKLTLKKELDGYKECLAKLTAKRREDEKRFDEKLAELVKQRDESQAIQKQKHENARAMLAKSVLKGREEQLKRKAEQECRDLEQGACEKQRLQKDISSFYDALSERNRSEADRKKMYAEQLRLQMEERKQRKLEEKLEELREKEAIRANEKCLDEELKRLAVNPPEWNKHPLRGVKYATHYHP